MVTRRNLIMFHLKTCFAVVIFLFGWLIFKLTGRTPTLGHIALVHLFCATGGRFNDFISKLLAFNPRRVATGRVEGVLGKFGADDIANLAEDLRRRGYLFFPSVVPTDVIDEISSFASQTKAHLRRMDCETSVPIVEKIHFDPTDPRAVRYDYDPRDVLDNRFVQDLLGDEVFLSISEAYLNCTPHFDVLSMWWHTDFKVEPDSEAAQLYHFDMDRVKWLKIFIYLTDVGPDDGPHAFISGSHKSNGIPQEFLRRGYSRLKDEEVLRYYGPTSERIFTAPRGSILIEDTRGLHKGIALRKGGSPRLMLQFQFSNSLFGAEYKMPKLRKLSSKILARMIDLHPETFRRVR